MNEVITIGVDLEKNVFQVHFMKTTIWHLDAGGWEPSTASRADVHGRPLV